MANEERKEAIKFKLEQPVKGTFLFDTPLEGESKGKDGEMFNWYMYKFKDSFDDEEVFFASRGLKRRLDEEEKLEERSWTITKVLMKDENGNLKEDSHGQAMNSFEVVFDDQTPEFPPTE